MFCNNSSVQFWFVTLFLTFSCEHSSCSHSVHLNDDEECIVMSTYKNFSRHGKLCPHVYYIYIGFMSYCIISNINFNQYLSSCTSMCTSICWGSSSDSLRFTTVVTPFLVKSKLVSNQHQNKLASLEAMLVRNYDRPTHRVTY